jgi:hypothetical protein
VNLAIMLLYVGILASTAQVLGQDSSKGPVSPYVHFILASCPGKDLEVTLKSAQKLSGKCHAPLSDHLQITHKGVTHNILYTSIAQINIRRHWFGKLKNAVAAPYLFIKMAMGIDELFKF